MDDYLIQKSTLKSIGDAIRRKTGATALITPEQMPEKIDGIAAGAELNFEIVGGTCAPANPSENTIWVNTENDITGWVFRSIEPDAVAEGMVWVSTEKSSHVAFNALNQNQMYVYPYSVYQCISGVFVGMPAQIYQNGTWRGFNSIPDFSYTGNYEIVDDEDNVITSSDSNWKVRFLTSGTLTFNVLKGATNGIDVFCVGGGGGGATITNSYTGAGGGGGGYTTTVLGFSVKTGTGYDIVIGGGGSPSGTGGTTSGFGAVATGGAPGSSANGGSGGSGGGCGGYSWDGVPTSGASDGETAENSYRSGGSTRVGVGGIGQGTTTKEFGDETGKLYAGGGAGGAGVGSNQVYGNQMPGGDGGGGIGGRNSAGGNGTINTGGGGGGGSPNNVAGGYGGSGIVVIRNAR